MKGWLGSLMGVALLVGTARADTLRAPQTVNAEPSSARSEEMSTRAANAEMKNDPRDAVQDANQGITADPADPWPYYNKAEALTRLGQTDEAVATYAQAEQRFAPSDLWGKSVAVFGRARALSQAGRCGEARAAFDEYAGLVKGDRPSVALAQRYAGACKSAAAAPHTR